MFFTLWRVFSAGPLVAPLEINFASKVSTPRSGTRTVKSSRAVAYPLRSRALHLPGGLSLSIFSTGHPSCPPRTIQGFGDNESVQLALSATGPTITAAGLIFAFTFAPRFRAEPAKRAATERPNDRPFWRCRGRSDPSGVHRSLVFGRLVGVRVKREGV